MLVPLRQLQSQKSWYSNVASKSLHNVSRHQQMSKYRIRENSHPMMRSRAVRFLFHSDNATLLT